MLEVLECELLSEDLLAFQAPVTKEKTTSQEEDNEEWALLSIRQNSERNTLTDLHQHVDRANAPVLCVHILGKDIGGYGPQHLV